MFTEGMHGHFIPNMPAPTPCPFCGGEPQVAQTIESTSDVRAVYEAICCDCGACGPGGESEIMAAAAWNKRSGSKVNDYGTCFTVRRWLQLQLGRLAGR